VTQAFDSTAASALPGAVRERPAAPATRPAPWWEVPPPRSPAFRWFTPALALLLGGYLFFDKSFAYLHVPGTPFFVGEIVLGIGFYESLRIRSPWYRLLRSSAILRMLLVFMGLCALRLTVDLPRYRLDAVRDSSIWYYGTFAFLVAAAVVAEPTFVPRLVRWYRMVLPWYLLWAPVAVALTEVDRLSSVYVPGTGTPINAFRYTDVAVHVAMGLAFLWLGVDRMLGARPERSRDLLISVVGLIALLVVGSQTRGGFLAGLATLAVVFAFLPSGRRRRIALSGAVGLLLVLVVVSTLDLRLEGDRRDVSVQQMAENLASLTGEETNDDLSGTVAWRQGFWQQALDDLLSSRAWLTGLGFGEILPDRYEVDVGHTNSETSTQPLRSLHNSHLTLLARIGFPGFGLWVLVWVIFAVHLLGWVRRRPGGVRDPSTALVVWLLAAVPGFLVGAYFDPSLEGPHVAIWLFTVVGVAAALTRDERVAVPATAVAGPSRLRAIASRVTLPRVVVEWPALLAVARRLRARVGWEVAEGVLAGLIGLAVGVHVARSLGVHELGAFSLAFATYLLVLAAFRGLASDALGLRYRGQEAAVLQWASAAATGTALAAGLVAGAVCALVGLVLPGSTGAALLGLGLTLPGLLVQDSWRRAFTAAGRPARAFANDLVWALAFAPAVAVLARTGRTNVGWVMLAWGGAATVAAAAGAVQAGLVPMVSQAAAWLRRDRDLAGAALGERLGAAGASQLRLYGLAVVASLAAVGSLQAAELLLGPVVLAVVVAAETEDLARLRLLPARRLLRSSLFRGALGAAAVLLWGAALLKLPDLTGFQLLRGAWLPASRLLLPVTLAAAGLAMAAGAWTGTRALAAAARSRRALLAGSAVYLAAALGGAAVGGAAGAAWGSAAGSVAGAALWWWELHRAVGEREPDGAG
jgi:O-antigen ligase